MASTLFVDTVTQSAAAWFNDVDTAAYGYLTGVAGTNTVTATGPASMTAYAAGQKFWFIPANTITSATTINITANSVALGAKNIFANGVACVGKEIFAGLPCYLIYDGTQFNIVNPAYGRWTTPAFSAGDFTANGSMTWTLAAGDVTTYEYIIIGKMMTVNWYLATTTIGGTPNTTLKIAIPASKVASKRVLTIGTGFNNSVDITTIAAVEASGTTIDIYHTKYIGGGTTWTAGADNAYVAGSITFEIN